MILLRCNGSPGCFDDNLRVICMVWSGVSHLPFENIIWILCGVNICWPIKHSNTTMLPLVQAWLYMRTFVAHV